MRCSGRTSKSCGGSRARSPPTTSATRSWIRSASTRRATASVRCFQAQVNATASSGRTFPGGLGFLRPPAEIELGAYGLDLRGLRVADIGAGEGRLALGAARDAASVLAVDPDRGALARGRAAARRQGVSNVKFSEGAAQSLRLPDASFDVVIFSWTL
ncbi:MAG: class I SAM-dependent methyltransferase [Chloroflexi bacterium]|nr:MAG: class I SAM-dependent methyltransferase [Chloroflexota bacterium]TME72474.1 MAG: class I SAM-dependent methyltransferase [Chloroflexota bacterium]TMG51681.1 MAG: class I SAM-dependent methyltransferase [Chloroflexota bacterium]